MDHSFRWIKEVLIHIFIERFLSWKIFISYISFISYGELMVLFYVYMYFTWCTCTLYQGDIKGTVSVNSSDPPCKDGNARFKTSTLKTVSDKVWILYKFFVYLNCSFSSAEIFSVTRCHRQKQRQKKNGLSSNLQS